MGLIHAVGPHKAAIVIRRRKMKIVSGGWVYASALDKVKYLSLGIMTLTPYCSEAETAEGVAVNVSAVAQCKIMNSPEFILIAAEQFLGRHQKYIAIVLSLTLEGHLRAILGTLTVEETYKDRKKFAALVCEVAATDVAKMGIEIVSFVIKDIFDTVGYLSALGKTRTAQVKRDAAIGQALANRDAGIKEAECEKLTNDVTCWSKMKIQDHYRAYHVKQFECDTVVNAAKAEAELAYDLQIAKLQQQVRYEEIAIEIIERKKEIEIQGKIIECKMREAIATTKLPATAESYRIQTIAEGEKAVGIAEAVGESERIKLLGKEEAYKFEITSVKEAERMKLKAMALQKYGDAAIKELIIKSLPEIASKISSPLTKIDEIVILTSGSSKSDKNLNRHSEKKSLK